MRQIAASDLVQSGQDRCQGVPAHAAFLWRGGATEKRHARRPCGYHGPLASCPTWEESRARRPGAHQRQRLHRRRTRSRAEAVAVSGGRIVAVGRRSTSSPSSAQARRCSTPAAASCFPASSTRTCTPSSASRNSTPLPDRPGVAPARASTPGPLRRASTPSCRPSAAAGGCRRSSLKAGCWPSDIDAVVADRPVMLSDDSCHLAWVNSAALRPGRHHRRDPRSRQRRHRPPPRRRARRAAA